MKKFATLFTAFLTLMVFGVVANGWSGETLDSANQVPIIVAGSGVNLGITRLLAQAFFKDHNRVITVPGSIGSKGAIQAVSEGAIPLGLISRPLKETEKKLGIIEKPYALVAIIIGAHSSVQDDAITSRELIEIFKGTKTRWKDGHSIIVQSREKWDSGFQVLKKLISGFKQAYADSYQAKRWTLYYTDQDANQALSNTPYAIGVTDLGMVATEHLRIKALKLDGIAPVPENVSNGTYPLRRRLSFIYRPEKISDGAKQFMDFTVTKKGRNILKANGFIPLP